MLETLEEAYDAEEWDEFSWLIPHLVKYGISPDKRLLKMGPEQTEMLLEEVKVADFQQQLKKLRR